MNLSPAPRKLTAAHSSAPVPEEGSMTTGWELSSSLPSFSDIPMKSDEKAAHLWLSICAPCAARTGGGTSTGPGVNRYFLKIKPPS